MSEQTTAAAAIDSQSGREELSALDGKHQQQSDSQECRFCGAPLEHLVVDLGISPLCENFLTSDQLTQMEQAVEFTLIQPEPVAMATLVEQQTVASYLGHVPITNGTPKQLFRRRRRAKRVQQCLRAIGTTQQQP